jgi:hypothetical protein
MQLGRVPQPPCQGRNRLAKGYWLPAPAHEPRRPAFPCSQKVACFAYAPILGRIIVSRLRRRAAPMAFDPSGVPKGEHALRAFYVATNGLSLHVAHRASALARSLEGQGMIAETWFCPALRRTSLARISNSGEPMYRTNAPPPSPPSGRTGVPWPIFYALLAGAGVALLVAVVALLRVRSFTRQVGLVHRGVGHPPARPLPKGLSAPPQAPVTEPPIPIVDDTAAASLRARPSWGRRETLTGHAEPTTQYAPQLSNPLEAFLAAEPLSAELRPGTVICRFQSFNKHDTFAGDDLHVRVTFGATLEVANDGPEDGNLAFVSAPLVWLAKGDRIAFEVFDRDVFGMASLTKSFVPFSQGPVVTMNSGAAMECRGLWGVALAKAVSVRASQASATLMQLENTKLDENRSDWAYPDELLSRAETEIANIAALAGWHDPRAHDRVVAYNAALLRTAASREALFDRLHEGATSTLQLGTLSVASTASGCGSSNCVALSVKNTGKSPASFGDYATVYFASRSRGPFHAGVTAQDGAGSKIKPGETVVRQLVPVGSLPDGPLLVGVCSRRSCGFLRAQ